MKLYKNDKIKYQAKKASASKQEKEYFNSLIKTCNAKIKDLQKERKDDLEDFKYLKNEITYIKSLEKNHYSCMALLYKEVSGEEYEKLPDKTVKGTAKSSILKRKLPGGKVMYYKLMFNKSREYNVTTKQGDNFTQYSKKELISIFMTMIAIQKITQYFLTIHLID